MSLLRIGHKGADAIRPGNTLESFAAAVEAGVDVIELDVLRPRDDFERATDWRRAPAGPAAAGGGPLLVAHDWADAARRDPLTLTEVLDAFSRPPLDAVGFNLDLKIAGREDEVVAAIRERELDSRAMLSTMELSSLGALTELAPELRRGWTVPRVRRDWTRTRLGRSFAGAAGAALRSRLPRAVRGRAPALGAWAVWAYHPLITRSLVESAHREGIALIAWTVDDPERMRALAALGVDGICTNDPRLLDGIGQGPPVGRRR